MACLFDATSALIVAAILSLGTVEPAFAYVDPSVMTYTIQALAGVAVALGAVAGVALRRTRKWIFKVLKIDENANKETEGDIHRISREEAAELDAATPIYTERTVVQNEKKLSWKGRFGIAFLAVLFCGFTLGITAPFELVAGNTSSLTYGLKDIWPIMAGATALCTVVLSLLISFLRGRAFNVAVLFICCSGVAMFAQALFMNEGLMLDDNQSVDWTGSYLPIMVISTIVWLAILVVPQILARRNQRNTRIAIVAVSTCMILVQAIGVGSLFVANAAEDDTMPVSAATQQGLLKVSGKSNVVCMVLDHFDERELERLIDADSHVLDFLPNSTVYTNAIQMMTPTEFSIPYMMTKVTPEENEDINASYLRRRYLEGTFLQSMNNAGYKVGLYTDTLRLNHLSNREAWERVGRLTENVHPIDRQSLSVEGTLKILTKAALYRNVPWVLKPLFLYTTPDLNSYVVKQVTDTSEFDNQPYICDNDIAFYHMLVDIGLSIDEQDVKGKYSLVHLDGNHWPWTKNENVEEVPHSDDGRDADAIGTLKIAEQYVQCLKDLGVYDTATIIITADHGDWETHEFPTDVNVPILIVKPATDGTAQNAPVYSAAPVSHEDLFATILQAMGASSNRYGNSLTEIEAQYGDNPSARVRDTYMVRADKLFATMGDLYLFNVQGDAKNWDDWTYADVTWHIVDVD